METPEFLSTSLHIITFFATPLHAVGTYCILYQTPKSMSSVKWVLFNYHCWCMLLDWTLTILTIPYLLFPALAGFPLGVLKEFGVSIDIHVYLVVTLMSAVGASIILIFENRYYIMFAMETRWKTYRKIFIAVSYGVSLTYFLPAVFTVPDQAIGLKHFYTIIPELPSYVPKESIFVFAIEFRWVVIPVNTLIAIDMIEWYPLFTLISRNMKKSMRMALISKSTLELQKKFMQAMYVQSAVLMFSLQVPVLYFAFSIFGNVYNQKMNNLCFVFLSFHGIGCTLVLLLVHKPYREFCEKLFGLRKGRTVSNALIVSIVHSNHLDEVRRISTF